jgi:hypothetical protein
MITSAHDFAPAELVFVTEMWQYLNLQVAAVVTRQDTVLWHMKVRRLVPIREHSKERTVLTGVFCLLSAPRFE